MLYYFARQKVQDSQFQDLLLDLKSNIFSRNVSNHLFCGLVIMTVITQEFVASCTNEAIEVKLYGVMNELRAVGSSENPGGWGSSIVVGIICPLI